MLVYILRELVYVIVLLNSKMKSLQVIVLCVQDIHPNQCDQNVVQIKTLVHGSRHATARDLVGNKA